MGNSGAQPDRRFAVAFSFPGEHRSYVEKVHAALCKIISAEKVFYDKCYEGELARPDLDVYLQSIYHDQSELIVIFLSQHYKEKEWCGLEGRAIRDVIKQRERDVMPFRFDNTQIDGFFSIDGCIDANATTPDRAAVLINQRLQSNPGQPLPPLIACADNTARGNPASDSDLPTILRELSHKLHELQTLLEDLADSRLGPNENLLNKSGKAIDEMRSCYEPRQFRLPKGCCELLDAAWRSAKDAFSGYDDYHFPPSRDPSGMQRCRDATKQYKALYAKIQDSFRGLCH